MIDTDFCCFLQMKETTFPQQSPFMEGLLFFVKKHFRQYLYVHALGLYFVTTGNKSVFNFCQNVRQLYN